MQGKCLVYFNMLPNKCSLRINFYAFCLPLPASAMAAILAAILSTTSAPHRKIEKLSLQDRLFPELLNDSGRVKPSSSDHTILPPWNAFPACSLSLSFRSQLSHVFLQEPSSEPSHIISQLPVHPRHRTSHPAVSLLVVLCPLLV